jgi:hypothetical protein
MGERWRESSLCHCGECIQIDAVLPNSLARDLSFYDILMDFVKILPFSPNYSTYLDMLFINQPSCFFKNEFMLFFA